MFLSFDGTSVRKLNLPFGILSGKGPSVSPCVFPFALPCLSAYLVKFASFPAFFVCQEEAKKRTDGPTGNYPEWVFVPQWVPPLGIYLLSSRTDGISSV